jgi:glutamyl-tRNA reductase
VAIVVIGVNHRTAPLELLERMAVAPDAMPKALHDLAQRGNVAEAVVLSTCNRTEVYASTERFHGAYADIRDFFCSLAGLPPEDLHDHLLSFHDAEAVTHLFEVASGLRSAVLGESEILGQVRDAWELAHEEGTARSALNLLFRRAVEAGKRARTETAIGRGTASVSHAAVEMARDRLGSLRDARVLVLGAGEVGAGMAIALAGGDIAEIAVTNRSAQRAAALAARVGGRVAPLTDLVDELAGADVFLTCTASEAHVVEAELIEAAMVGRSGRPLLIVDVAVPRDVDPAAAHIDDVTLFDLDDLRDWADRGLAARAREADQVRQIVADEVLRYLDDASAREVAPLVASLHQRAEALRVSELARLRARVSGLTDDQDAAVDALTRAIVAKLLHDPAVRLKADAGTPRGERNSAALRDLFDLP